MTLEEPVKRVTFADAMERAKGLRVHGPRTTEEEVISVLAREVNKLTAMEKQYCESLGEMARLSGVLCGWFLSSEVAPENAPDEVIKAAEEIMEYVEAVRPG